MMETEYKDGRITREEFDDLSATVDAAINTLVKEDVKSVKITKLIPGRNSRRK